MRIAIVGAGGIGGYTGGRLAAAGVEVSFVARGAHLAALREQGLLIESPAGNVQLERVAATERPDDVGPVDVVLFSVKLWDIEGAAESIRPMLGPETLVVTVQNGVESADILARHIKRDQIAAGSFYISSHIARPGVIAHVGGDNRIVVEGLGGDARVLAFQEACSQATALRCEVSDGSDDFLWRKFIALTAFSGATALLRKPLGEIRDNPDTLQFLRDLVFEASAVALASGRRLPPGVGDEVFDTVMKWPAAAVASMAVDLEHGRRLELRWLSGRVHTLGAQLGIPTPSHTAVFRGLLMHEMGATHDG